MNLKRQMNVGIVLMGLWLNLFFYAGIRGYAEEDAASSIAKQTGYTVETIQPETQIDRDYTFFYIHAKPEEEQTLKLKVISKRKEPSKLKISLTNAANTSSGQIDYGQKSKLLDDSLKVPLTDFVTLPEKEITVSNFEEKIVEIKVKPPKKAFEGVRLGALVFETVDGEKENESVSSSYGYKIAVMVNEDLRPFNQGGEIVYQKVEFRLQNGEKVVSTSVQNPKPYVLENVSMQTKIRRKGQKEVLYSNNLSGMKLAPNSSFDFLTYLGIEDVQSGKYILNATATDGKETWDWEKEFEITGKEAEKMNKEAAYKLTLPKLYKGLGMGLVVLTLINTGYLVYRRRKNTEMKQGGGKDDAKEG